MALSECELSFLRLLERTKKLSRDDLSKNVWIVKASATHLTSLLSQMQDEKRTYNSEVLMQYGREVNQLTMLVEAEQKKKVEDRLAAVEQIPSRFMDFSDQKAATTSQESSSEVRLRNKSVYRADLRQQLLGEDRRRQAGGNLASHVEDVSRHEQMHEDLANELLNMTKSLKMNMKIAGDVIRDDNQRLGKMSQQVDSNKERLQAESTRLAHHAYKCGFDCFIIFLFLFIFWSFISMSTSSQKDDWLSKMLPSQAFLKNHVRFPVHKERLSNRITELHIFHDNLLSGRSMPVLDDSSWLTFFRMHNPEERVRYLLELSPVESTAVVNDGRLISERNEERHSKGEMVYAPGYNSIWELQGGDFRRKLDTMFVSRLLAQKRADSSLPKLILDCRFMREFSVAIQNKFAKQINNAHNSNWNLRIPFNMSIANFSADSQLSDIVKRSWLFRYGPPSSRENFQSNSFYPSISARSITEVADCAPESIMYISSRATEFLPEEPPADVGAVVICASHDIQSWSSSLSAAKKDGIRAYRIPFQRHSIIESGQKTSYLFPELIPILSAYFSGNDIGEPIRSAISASLTPRKGSVREETEFVEKYKAACKSLELEQSRQQKYQQWLTRPAKPRVHRYSREERRQRQAA